MSFSTTPKAGPSILKPGTASPHNPPAGSSAASARERAIKALAVNASPAPSQPSAPEDMPVQASVSPPQEPEQINTSEEAPVSSEVVTESSPKPEGKASEEPLSAQFAILARKEKALRAKALAQEQALKAKEDAIRAQEEAMKAKEAEYSSKYISKDRLTQDTLNALAEAGLTYEQITNMMLNPPQPQDMAYKGELEALKAEIKALRGETESTKKTFQEQQTQSYQQAVNQIRSEATKLVSSDPMFETIKETGSVGEVVKLIEQTFKEDGILMTVEEAAQQVEDYLIEEALKLSRIKKIQQRLNPVQSSVPPASVPAAAPKQPQLKTLTNAVSASRPLNARERAILAFKGQNK